LGKTQKIIKIMAENKLGNNTLKFFIKSNYFHKLFRFYEFFESLWKDEKNNR
jgi:hypothetical protein